MSVLPVIVNFVEDFSDPWAEISSVCGIPRDFRMMNRRPRSLRLPYNCEKRCRLARKLKSPEKDGFEMNLDVKQFRPEEILVKTVDNQVVVEAKHEEREDENSFVSRHFISRYSLPKDCDVQEMVSSLSADGVLTVKAPPLHKAIESKERIIEIQRTNTPHLSEKDKTPENLKDSIDASSEK